MRGINRYLFYKAIELGIGITLKYVRVGNEQVPHMFVLHIPAHHEHSFWFNVNTDSGGT